MPSAESAEGTAAEAGDEALEGEAQDIRDNLIAGGAEILAEYPLGVLSLSEAGARKLVAACAVGESSDGSVIAAFPGKCWNRAAAKRVIGLDLVRKVSTVRVKCADPENRGQALDSDLRICLGLLTTEGEAAFDFVRDFEEDIDIDYPFGPPDQPELLPHGEALAELAKNTFEFLTGESAPPENPTTSAGAGAQGVEERLGRLEGCFLSIQEDLKKLVGSRAESGTAPPHVEAGAPSSAPIRASAKRAPGPDLSGMDQSVVKAALDSGIEMKHIEEMGKFLRSQRPMEDEPRASAKTRFARRTRTVEDDLDDEDPEDENEEAVAEGTDPIHAAVSKLTAIAAQLAEGKKKDSSLDALLDGSGSADSSTTTAGSRKSAAALRALKERLRSQPRELSKVIDRNMSADFSLRSSMPGSSQIPVSCRAWLESRSRVQHYPSTISFLWIIAGIGDALREERHEEAYLRCLLGLAAGDQLSIDRGNWNDPPPFPAFATHTLPAGAEVPFTKLVDARWMEIFMARLRDVDLYLESRRKLASGPGAGARRGEDGGAPPGRPEIEETPAAPPRKPLKGSKGKGRDSKGAATSEEK
ncbi:unnamed protein product [Symbiodinium sp. KB8]|nr:unnamed protein product [Symbiodinium sp. KB8]